MLNLLLTDGSGVVAMIGNGGRVDGLGWIGEVGNGFVSGIVARRGDPGGWVRFQTGVFRGGGCRCCLPMSV